MPSGTETIRRRNAPGLVVSVVPLSLVGAVSLKHNQSYHLLCINNVVLYEHDRTKYWVT